MITRNPIGGCVVTPLRLPLHRVVMCTLRSPGGATTPMHRHERRHPTPSELAHGAGLLDAIPSAGRNWNTPQGAAFIAWAEQLSRYGDVPTAWLAEDLGLEPGTVYTTMTRYRQSA